MLPAQPSLDEAIACIHHHTAPNPQHQIVLRCGRVIDEKSLTNTSNHEN